MEATVVLILALVGIVMALPTISNAGLVAFESDYSVIVRFCFTSPTQCPVLIYTLQTVTGANYGMKEALITTSAAYLSTSTFTSDSATPTLTNTAETTASDSSSGATLVEKIKAGIIIASLLVSFALVSVVIVIHSQLALRHTAVSDDQPSISLQEVVDAPVPTVVGRQPTVDAVFDGLRL